MRFWDTPVHTKLIESERAVRRFVDCTPSRYRFWAVVDTVTDQCLGVVNYHCGHTRNRHADIGYIVTPARQHQGIASEAVAALLAHCFGALGFYRVQALIHPDNAASRALAERLGFRWEGLLRDHLRVGNEWRDDMLYALLAPDWAVIQRRS